MSDVRSSLPTFRRVGVALLALVLVSLGTVVVAAPAAAAGAPIVIDDFAGTTLGTRTVTNEPTHDSTTTPGTFSQSGGLGTMTSFGDNNTAGSTQLDYAMSTPTDITAAGNNRQFFLEFASIARLPVVTPGEPAAHISIDITDSAGHHGTYSTSVSNIAPENIVLNFFCDVSSVCFQGNADFSEVSHISINVAYPTNADPGHTLTSVIDTIRTTPIGGAVPDPLAPQVTTASDTVGSLNATTVHFGITYTLDGAPTDAPGLDRTGISVKGTAGGIGSYTVTGGPRDYDVAVGPLTSTGTATVQVKAAAITDTWGQRGLASSNEPQVTFTRFVAPVITSGATYTWTAGTAVTDKVTATGVPAPTFSEVGTLPSGVTLAGNGSFTGTPATGSGGVYPITVKASSAAGTVTKSVTITNDEAPSFSSAGTAAFTVGVAHSFTITTKGFPTASISGISTPVLPAGLSLVDNGDGTATISGEAGPTTGRAYSVALTASNGIGGNASQVLTVSVAEAPAITLSPDTQTVKPGTSVSFVAGASGFPAPTVKWQRKVAGGAYTDIPGATSPTYTFTANVGDDDTDYQAVFTNATGSASTSAHLSVQQAPTITSSDSTIFLEGADGSFTVTTDGLPSAAITAPGKPGWVTVHDNGDGTASISGTPPDGLSGTTVAVPLHATNGVDPDADQTLTIAIDLLPAVVTDPANTTVIPGTPIALTATAVGSPTPTVQWQRSVDGGGSFQDIVGATSGTLSFVAARADSDDEYQAVFTNRDGQVTTTAATVRVGIAPIITSAASATWTVGTPESFTFTTTGTPVAGISVIDLPSWLNYNDNGDGTVTLSATPTSTDTGVFDMTFTATNSFAPDASQSFALTVEEAPAITSAATDTFAVGTNRSFTVTSTAGFPSTTAITEQGALPDGVTFADAGDGTATISGTPAAGSGADYPITFTAAAVGGTTPGTIQHFDLIVDESASFTSSDSATFVSGAASTFTVATDAGFPTALGLTESGDLPTGVTFLDNGDGTATIAGTSTAVGTYPLTLKADKPRGATVSQSFTLFIATPPTFTSSADSTFTVGEPSSVTITTTPGLPAATTLSVAGSLPTGLTFTDNGDGTATLSGAPAIGTTGPYSVTYVASNGTPPDATQLATITVADAPSAPLPPTLPASDAALHGVPAQTTQGEVLTISGSGYAPGASVNVGIYSSPTPLTTVAADARGAFTAKITIPKFTGHHTVVTAAVDPAGATRFLEAGTDVTAPTATGLAFTGSDDAGLLAVAILLLAAGLGLAAWMTRRRWFSARAPR